MKKIIVTALAVYGGAKLTEKIVNNYKDDIVSWVGKKVSKGIHKMVDDIFNIKKVEPIKSRPSHSPRYDRVDHDIPKNPRTTTDPRVRFNDYYMTLENLTTEETLYIVKKFHEYLNEYEVLTPVDIVNNIDPFLYHDLPAYALKCGWDIEDQHMHLLKMYESEENKWAIEFPRMTQLEID